MPDAAQPLLPMFDDEALAAPMAPAEPARTRRAPKAGPPTMRPGDARDLRAARRSFLGLAAAWNLSGPEVLRLLGEPLADEAERHERLRALLSVHRSLQLLAPDPTRCRALLRQPDPAFDDGSPLSLMLAGGQEAIARVRVHLAAQVAALP